MGCHNRVVNHHGDRWILTLHGRPKSHHSNHGTVRTQDQPLDNGTLRQPDGADLGSVCDTPPLVDPPILVDRCQSLRRYSSSQVISPAPSTGGASCDELESICKESGVARRDGGLASDVDATQCTEGERTEELAVEEKGRDKLERGEGKVGKNGEARKVVDREEDDRDDVEDCKVMEREHEQEQEDKDGDERANMCKQVAAVIGRLASPDSDGDDEDGEPANGSELGAERANTNDTGVRGSREDGAVLCAAMGMQHTQVTEGSHETSPEQTRRSAHEFASGLLIASKKGETARGTPLPVINIKATKRMNISLSNLQALSKFFAKGATSDSSMDQEPVRTLAVTSSQVPPTPPQASTGAPPAKAPRSKNARWCGLHCRRSEVQPSGRVRSFFQDVVNVSDQRKCSVGNAVRLASGNRRVPPYIGRVLSIWQEGRGDVMLRVKWYYRPENLPANVRRRHVFAGKELVASRHIDDNSCACLLGVAYVATETAFEHYREGRSPAVVDSDAAQTSVPDLEQIVPLDANKDLVYFCKRKFNHDKGVLH